MGSTICGLGAVGGSADCCLTRTGDSLSDFYDASMLQGGRGCLRAASITSWYFSFSVVCNCLISEMAHFVPSRPTHWKAGFLLTERHFLIRPREVSTLAMS